MANLSLYHPHVRQLFLCPICRELYGPETLATPDPQVTVAHIVPEAVGGREWTLTCKRCNSDIGSRYDSHLVKEHRFAQWERGGRPLPARLRSSGAEIGVEIERSGGGWTFRLISNQTDPAESQAFFEGAQKWHGFRFTATLPQFNTKARQIALVHSAFLMMFRMFGYEYVLSPEAESILGVLREKRNAQEEGDAARGKPRCAVVKVKPDTNDAMRQLPTVGLLVQPPEFRCFAVSLPDPRDQNAVRMATLPGFGQRGVDCYERILSTDGKWEFEARTIGRVPLEHLAAPQFKWWAHRLWECA